MIEYLTGDDVASEVMLTRATFKGTILLVEGMSDEKFYSTLINIKQCKALVSHGKSNACDAIKKLEEDKIKGILAIVDSDFDKIRNITIGSNNTFITDVHDAEIMQIDAGVLETLCREYCTKNKMDKILNKSKLSSITELILNTSLQIAWLRLSSLELDLNIDFNDLKYSKFIDRETLKFNQHEFIKYISANQKIKQADITNCLDIFKNCTSINILHAVCGHDAVAVFSIGLRKAIGSNDSKLAETGNIAKLMRLVYEKTHFETTELYNNLIQWEMKNLPFKVMTT